LAVGGTTCCRWCRWAQLPSELDSESSALVGSGRWPGRLASGHTGRVCACGVTDLFHG
jgi:hypothetical protein